MDKLMTTKPLSKHWADLFAYGMIKKNPSTKKTFNIASGITPSGVIHLGNFREVFTAYIIAKALTDLEKTCNFYLSFDSFDSYRKVAQNYPDNTDYDYYQSQLGKPLTLIKDPWHKEDQTDNSSNLAQARMNAFIHELKCLSITPKFIDQSINYQKNIYSHLIKKALQNTDHIKKILSAHRNSPLPNDWLPVSCYCKNCHKNTQDLSYDGNYTILSKCNSCGHTDSQDIRTSSNIKLKWRIDWPMRWAYEDTDFEPGGKDHSSQGGSYHTGKEISLSVFKKTAPQYLGYDFVSIKGSKVKMSSSKGNVFTISECLEIYTPEIIKWIFANNKPNHPFAIAFDQDVIKVYDEFDTICLHLTNQKITKNYDISQLTSSIQKKITANQRIFSLCDIDLNKMYYHHDYNYTKTNTNNKKDILFAPSFRGLCDRIQICGHDHESTLKKFYPEYCHNHKTKHLFFARAQKASSFLKNHAPKEFVFNLNSNKQFKSDIYHTLNTDQLKIINSLSDLAKQKDFNEISSKDLHDLLYKHIVHGLNLEPKLVFSTIYQSLIAKNTGPKLALFLHELGSSKVLSIIE